MVLLLFFQTKPTFYCSGEGGSHTTTQSDLEGPAVQLNPVLIQMSTPCVPLALLCHLYVQQHKTNPGFAPSGNEIRCSSPNAFRLYATSSGHSEGDGLLKKLSRPQLLIQKGSGLL